MKSTSITCTAFSILMLFGIAATAATPLSDQSDMRQAAQICMTCHNHNGNSDNPNFPRIAGQQLNYIENTLHAFRDHSRGDYRAIGYMWGMMQNRSDEEIHDLATYFSSVQATPNRKGNAEWAAKGKAIYESGISEKSLPACMACHGPNGEGSAVAPRLAGQHKGYLLNQLAAFRGHDRHEATVMPGIVTLLTPDDEKAVVNYLQGL